MNEFVKRCLFLCILIGCIGAAALPGIAASSSARERSVLDDVAALQKPITYRETKISLGELVEKIGSETGVALFAAPEVIDEPVTVVVKEMSARQLLKELADLLDYRWRRRAGERNQRRAEGHETPPETSLAQPEPQTAVYEIFQDLAARQREEALRQAVRNHILWSLQQAIRGAMEMTALSSEELQAVVKSGEPLRWAVARTPEEFARRKRMLLAEQLSSPVSRELAHMLGRLTSEEWARLLTGGEIAFSSHPRSGDLPLPSATVALFRLAAPSMADPVSRQIKAPQGIVEEVARQREMVQRQLWLGATGYRVVIQLDPASLETMTGTVSLQATVEIPTGHLPATITAPGGQTVRPSVFVGGVGTRLSLSASARDVERERADETRHRVEMEKDPTLGTARSFQPGSIPGINAFEAGLWWLRDLLPELARTYDVDFIADAYWCSAPVLGGAITRQPTALYRILDHTAGALQQWERRGRLIRMRSRTWFTDRPREVPLRLVRRWRAVCLQHGALPLEDWLGLIGALTGPQIESLPAILPQAGLPTEFGQAPSARYLLPLYASLPPVQQEALWQERIMPVQHLSGPQRELLTLAVREMYRRIGLTPLAMPLSGGDLSLVKQPRMRTVEPLAGRYRYRDETMGVTAIQPPAQLPASGAPRLPSPTLADAAERPKRHPVVSLHFQVREGSQTHRTAAITLAQP